MRIALIPDRTMTGRVIRRHLSRLGHEIMECSPDAGGCCTEGHDIHIVVFGRLPAGCTPTELIRRLAARGCRAPCIAILRQDQSIRVETALEAGIQAILREPLRLEELELALARTPRGAMG